VDAAVRAKKAIWRKQDQPVRDQIAALLDAVKQSTIKDLSKNTRPEIQAVTQTSAERNRLSGEF